MMHMGRVWLVCVFASWGVTACDDGAHQYDDIPTPPQVGAVNPAAEHDAGAEDAGADEVTDDDRPSRPTRRPTESKTNSKPRAGSKDKGDDKGDADNNDDDGSNDDRDNQREPDAEPEPDPDLPPIAGTAGPAGCYSYTAASDGMCGGDYCGVTEAQLRAEIPEGSVCGDDPEFTCTGNLVAVSGACARRIKGNMPFASNEALRPAIVNCVHEDSEIAERVSSACLDCFLDALDCVGQACLTECLNGDSPQCDRCGQNAGCNDRLFSCGDLPNPR